MTWLEVTGQLAGTSLLQSGIRPCQCGVPGGGGCLRAADWARAMATSSPLRQGQARAASAAPGAMLWEPGTRKRRGGWEAEGRLGVDGFPTHCDGALPCRPVELTRWPLLLPFAVSSFALGVWKPSRLAFVCLADAGMGSWLRWLW